MRVRRFVNGVGDFFDMMGSAIAVSAAVRDHRPARPADLKRLGLDPEVFGRINR